MEQPAEGYCTKGTVTRVIDGDTLEVTLTKVVRVRLNDVNCPETRTMDLEEKELGFEAKAFAERLALGKQVTLFIPHGRQTEILTLDRVLGTVWVENSDQTLGEKLKAAGHGT